MLLIKPLTEYSDQVVLNLSLTSSNVLENITALTAVSKRKGILGLRRSIPHVQHIISGIFFPHQFTFI